MGEVVRLTLLCLLLALGCWGVFAWGFWGLVSRDLGGLDGILLLLTSLLLAVVFSGAAYSLLRSEAMHNLLQPGPPEPDGTKQSSAKTTPSN